MLSFIKVLPALALFALASASRQVTITQSGTSFEWTMTADVAGVVSGTGDFPDITIALSDTLWLLGNLGGSHNFLIKDSAGAVVAGNAKTGGTFIFEWTPSADGIYTYYCSPHEGYMKGTIIVRASAPDPCNAYVCGKDCTGDCGWSKNVVTGGEDGTCVSGGNTPEGEEALGDCTAAPTAAPTPAPTPGGTAGTPAETKDESTSAATTDHDDQNKTSTIFNLKVGLGVVSTLLAVAILYVARTTHAARQARREAALGKATAAAAKKEAAANKPIASYESYEKGPTGYASVTAV